MIEPLAPDGAAAIVVEGVTCAFGARLAVDDVSLAFSRGSFTTLVGPSGCGKTTLLKTINRLMPMSAGRILVDGVDASSVDPTALRRRIGYVIQNVGLFPHMTIARNVAVVPELLGWPRERIEARVDELLELVHLPPAAYRDRYPRELSGGQQQRVGIARALAGDPAIVLMDEPFGAVDAIERAHLQDELSALQRRLHKTVVFVTHDVDEALRLADAIVVMRDGRVVQSGSPADLLFHPADAFVAELLSASDALRRLSVVFVRDALIAGGGPAAPISIDVSATLRDALSKIADSAQTTLDVVEGDRRIGSLTLDAVLAHARHDGTERG